MQTVLITGGPQTKKNRYNIGKSYEEAESLWFDYVIDTGRSRPCTKYLPRLHPASYECSNAHDSTSPVCIDISGTADGQGCHYHSFHFREADSFPGHVSLRRRDTGMLLCADAKVAFQLMILSP